MLNSGKILLRITGIYKFLPMDYVGGGGGGVGGRWAGSRKTTARDRVFGVNATSPPPTTTDTNPHTL